MAACGQQLLNLGDALLLPFERGGTAGDGEGELVCRKRKGVMNKRTL